MASSSSAGPARGSLGSMLPPRGGYGLHPWTDVESIHSSTAADKDDMIVSEEHCALLEAIQSRADKDWREHRDYIAGRQAAESIRHYSVLYSHPEFPVFTTALATMPAMGNGVTINLWGDPDPVVLPVFNMNFSQTRIASPKPSHTSTCHCRSPTGPSRCRARHP